MENESLSKRTISFGLALGIACLVNAVVVVVKESSPAVMHAMQGLTGHHWVTHSALVMLIFLGLGGCFTAMPGGPRLRLSARRLLATLACAIGLAAAIIIGFYLFAD